MLKTCSSSSSSSICEILSYLDFRTPSRTPFKEFFFDVFSLVVRSLVCIYPMDSSSAQLIVSIQSLLFKPGFISILLLQFFYGTIQSQTL
ncbi:hypothetical protein FGO68_gene10638 [Halteria grandinella]|uniref:Uncharacterized protein n=1 Tax=Halteria grandinella TaxID=5974 RepID=A0A8J8P2Z5_HALGN|nr:hypothetical protein FGO68_gene10638 [Halteria grandinella]